MEAGDGNERNWQNRGVDFTNADYEALMIEQNGKCATCKNVCSTGKRLAVDHDHETGIVRGLLCFKCNVILGKVKDDPVLLMALAAYVVEHRL